MILFSYFILGLMGAALAWAALALITCAVQMFFEKHRRWRSIARSARRWPREQHPSYFSDSPRPPR